MSLPIKVMFVRSVLGLHLCACPLVLANDDVSNRFSEIIFAFKEKKSISYFTDNVKNALIISFKKTSAEELTNLDTYDSRLIKRVLVDHFQTGKDESTRLSLILRDRNIKTTVDIFEDPHRLSIKLFDNDYVAKSPLGSGISSGRNSNLIEHSSSHTGTKKTVGRKINFFKDVLDVERGFLDFANAGMNVMQGPVHDWGSHSLSVQSSLDPYRLSGHPIHYASLDASRMQQAQRLYPLYIYPLPHTLFVRQTVPAKQITESAKILSLAKQALQLFQKRAFRKATLLYQQITIQDKGFVKRHPKHLLVLAESYLGSGSLFLADRYYQMLSDAIPGSSLAFFAHLRQLDVQAIHLYDRLSLPSLPVQSPQKRDRRPKSETFSRFLKESERSDAQGLISEILEQLNNLDVPSNNEMQLQVLIRKAYWQAPLEDNLRTTLPTTSDEVVHDLVSAYKGTSLDETKVLAMAIILWNQLKPGVQWSDNIEFLARKFLRSTNQSSQEGAFHSLQVKIADTVMSQIIFDSNHGQDEKAVAHGKFLRRLKVNRVSPETNWALGQANRRLGRFSKAHFHYKKSAVEFPSASKQFEALFMSAFVKWEEISKLRDRVQTRGSPRIRTLLDQAAPIDIQLATRWPLLKVRNQEEFRLGYKKLLVEAVKKNMELKTASRILLEGYEKGFHEASLVDSLLEDNQAEVKVTYTPSSDAVRHLNLLIRQLAYLALLDERERAIKLIKSINPKKLELDTTAQKIWRTRLIGLAEELRLQGEFLDSGRLYALVAVRSTQPQDNAEAFYKAGLLLQRAGVREEALEAFTKASQDMNNVSYAKLAKKRLDQLSP